MAPFRAKRWLSIFLLAIFFLAANALVLGAQETNTPYPPINWPAVTGAPMTITNVISWTTNVPSWTTNVPGWTTNVGTNIWVTTNWPMGTIWGPRPPPPPPPKPWWKRFWEWIWPFSVILVLLPVLFVLALKFFAKEKR